MQRRHLYRKREQIIDKRVQKFIRHRSRGHVRDGFKPVVDIQRRDHHEEAVRVHGAHERGEQERIPALMFLVEDAVGGVGGEEGDRDHVKVAEGDLVVVLGFLFRVGESVFVFEG